MLCMVVHKEPFIGHDIEISKFKDEGRKGVLVKSLEVNLENKRTKESKEYIF